MHHFILFLLLTSALTSVGQTNRSLQSTTNTIVLREPFTLTLPVDKEHYYEQKFGKTPYVLDGDVYLFKGDEFGLVFNIDKVKYEPLLDKSDVTLKFTQETAKDGAVMMMLVIQNHSKRKLFVDAVMTVPGKPRTIETSILPIEAGLSGYESWPHPIVQLVLRNLRFQEKP